MRETNKEDLKQAYKSEKDPRTKIRILAVHMVRVRKKGIDETAAGLMVRKMGPQLAETV